MKQYIGGRYITVHHDSAGYYIIERDKKGNKIRVPVKKQFEGKRGWRTDWNRFLK